MWKTIKEFNDFEISEDGKIRNKKTRELRKIPRNGYILFGKLCRSIKKLVTITFPPTESIDEVWKVIVNFPNYKISNKGRIKNSKTEYILRKDKIKCINLLDSKIHSISVKKLLYEYFPQKDSKDETWKDIFDYILYEVSDKGRVRNKTNGRIMKPDILTGYAVYTLYKNCKPKRSNGHYLVLTTFRPDLKRNETINHKDGNKLNNNLENLEWLSQKENSQHAADTGLMKTFRRQIYQINKDTDEIINTFNCAYDAVKFLKVGRSSDITTTCRGRQKTAYGYKWKYVTEERTGHSEKDMKTLDGEKWEKYLDSNYEISTFGRVKNATTKCILITSIKSKREKICIIIDGKRTNFYVYRLVALTYIPNPKNLPHVDHIDKNPMNNRLDNLRWSSIKDNVRYSNAKSIDQFDLEGNFIKTWFCMSDASRELNPSKKITSGISLCCNGKLKTSLGFKWRFTEKVNK